ncbi:hypothetical protein H2200_005880 [Cladophialophora chaetospira]|uniref:Sensor histidine kinase/response regulator n=1 Tax=Cladophialophora chaetospira TaxID=386627 RepID=A0AA39CI09_9EURO|nr:hypothetical protein H2200_005880 [Cladophialophora chaetospira]
MAVLPGDGAATAPSPDHHIADARRAREFYHYFQPDNLVQPHLRRRPSVFDIAGPEVPNLSKALSPIAQLTAIRMKCRKTMINVMDRDVMYFLSEAMRVTAGTDEETFEFVEDPILVACSSLPLKGRICELTLRLDNAEASDTTPMFVINDLTQSQFADMAIITGPPYYRFYAGVPIQTRDGINIGSLAVMDTQTRPNGLTPAEQAFLATTAGQIMLFLETNRQAIEGRQARKMGEGLEAFIAGRKSIQDDKTGHLYNVSPRKRPKSIHGLAVQLDGQASSKSYGHSAMSLEPADEVSTSGQSSDTDDPAADSEIESEPRTRAKTFGRAANILRECLGSLGEDGAVAFVNIGTSLDEPMRKRSATIYGAAAVNGFSHPPATKASFIAYSTQANNFIPETGLDDKVKLDAETLKELVKRYPGGRLFALDTNVASSSEDDTVTSMRRRPSSDKPTRRKQIELDTLRAAFPSAGQVLFTPLWDATTGSFAYACFVATALETRSFAASTELSFLNSFCSTLIGECSRLDTILADKQKSDFVGTISHEMRSPLHGLLASVEFLSETDLSGFQSNLISTIDSCGRTLLDTINHVLDFSKINSFQKHWQASNKKHGSRRHAHLGPDNTSKSISHGAPALLQLLGVVDVSAVLEEVVDGLVLGHTYTSGLDLTDMSREARGRGVTSKSENGYVDPVKITLEVQKADWTFLTQPGAVRRIIMNLTGNAIKYTSKGSITVSLQLQDLQGDKIEDSMILTVRDTGKGISQEFLNSKLFMPFAQENSLAPGTGLGLSIVRSIVVMLGGTIDVKSKLHEGTTVTVALPLKRPLPGQNSTQTTPYSDAAAGALSTGGSSADNSLLLLREQWADASVTLWQSEPQVDGKLRHVVGSYVQDWCGLQFVDQQLCDSSSVVLVEEGDLEPLLKRLVLTPGRRPALVVMCSVLSRHTAALVQSLEQRVRSAVEFVSEPCGPHKLARSIRLALERQSALLSRFSRTYNQKVILPTPEPPESAFLVPEPESISADLAEMDLNGPGELDDAKVVQATETFAASQASQNAQMAIHDPMGFSAMRTPRNHVSEGDSFPFPESSRRRDSDRGLLLERSLSDEATPMPEPDRRSRGLSTSAPATNEVNPRVLLVDDNRINLRLLETFLKSKRKYTKIEQAEDGQQAVDAVTAGGEPFDIIFMDISMPVLDGFEATRAIREFEDGNHAKPGAMIIALTGLASARDQTEVFNSGCDIYMTKPVSFKEVGKLLNNWEAHRTVNATSGPD